jgi:hypothetical protein
MTMVTAVAAATVGKEFTRPPAFATMTILGAAGDLMPGGLRAR